MTPTVTAAIAPASTPRTGMTMPELSAIHPIAFPTALKNAVAAGSTATIIFFLKMSKLSAKSLVALAEPAMVCFPFLMLLTSLSNSKRPSIIARAMSGPARAPNSSIALRVASVGFLAFLIWPVSISNALPASVTPWSAIRPSAIRREPMTRRVLTPSFSNLPTIAVASSKSKPSERSGDPNCTIVEASLSTDTPVF